MGCIVSLFPIFVLYSAIDALALLAILFLFSNCLFKSWRYDREGDKTLFSFLRFQFIWVHISFYMFMISNWFKT